MRCPRCRMVLHIHQYTRLAQIKEFESDTAPIYKCPKSLGGCAFLFAPADVAVLEALIGTERRDRVVMGVLTPDGIRS